MKNWLLFFLLLVSCAASAQQPVQLQTSGTSYDARQTRALTSSDQVTAVQPTGSNLHIQCDSGCGTPANAVVLFSNVSLASGSTSTISTLPGGYTSGTLNVSWNATSGTPSGCSVSMTFYDAGGAAVATSLSYDLDDATGVNTNTFDVENAGAAASQVTAQYFCTSYAAAGTLSMSLMPTPRILAAPETRFFASKSATASVTGQTLVLPTSSAAGALTVKLSGITGSPSGCGVVLTAKTLFGNSFSTSAQTYPVDTTKAVQTIIVPGINGSTVSSYIEGDWSCTVYPTAGKVEARFNPIPSVTITGKESKDANRTYVTLYAQLLTGVTSEALATFTKNVGGTSTTGQTAYTITNGKTFRIQALSCQIKNTTTTANNLVLNVRVAASVSASSPIVLSGFASSPAATATNTGTCSVPIPDGLEIAGNGSLQIGISHLENVTTASITSFILVGYEY